LASSAVTPPPNGGLMADPLWKMIWPPVCAEAAVAQLPLMFDPELKVMVPLGLGQAADAAAVERIYCDVVAGDLRPGRRVDSGTSIERRVGSDGARSGGKRNGAAAGNRASLSSRAVEQAAAGDQGTGRQQNF
jgi:hypothetical protein